MKKAHVDENDQLMCTTIGILLHDKHVQSTENKENNIKHGLQSMCFVADKGNIIGQINAGITRDIPRAQAIKYLLQAYTQSQKQNDVDMQVWAKEKLAYRIPMVVHGQYDIFKEYVEKNDKFTAMLYLEKLQEVQPTIMFVSEIAQEKSDLLLGSCRNNVFLKQLADKILQPSYKPKDREQGAALLRAGVLSYSKDKTELFLSVKYLNALSGTFTTACSIFLLGCVYCKLSSLFEQDNSPALQKAYLQKSVECGCPHAIAKMREQQQLLFFNTIHHGDQATLETLFNEEKSSFMQNKKYIKAARVNVENPQKANALFHKIVKKASHPHAYCMLAVVEYDNFAAHINNCFKTGIINKNGEEYAVFIDRILLGLIHDFIANITVKETDKTKEFLTILVEQLTQHNININGLKQLLLQTNNINLDNHL